MIVASDDMLRIDPHWLQPARTADTPTPSRTGLAEIERQAILDALDRCDGRIYGPGGAAAALGLKPTTLYGKMRKLHISRPNLSSHS